MAQAEGGEVKRSERMLAWLRSQGVKLSDAATICRTYAGRHQRAAGSWTWYVDDPQTLVQIGGYEPLGDLLKCPNLEVVFQYYGHMAPTRDRDVLCGCKGACKRRAGRKKEDEHGA